jgi:hypothetical protein
MTELKKITIDVDGKEVTLDVAEAEKLYELLARLLGKSAAAVVYQPYPLYVPPPTYGPPPVIPYEPFPPLGPNWTITC